VRVSVFAAAFHPKAVVCFLTFALRFGVLVGFPCPSALIRKWQARDLDLAKVKHAKVEQFSRQTSERQRRQKEMATPAVQNEVKRDTGRLLAPTAASGAGALTTDELDAAEYRRNNAGAHGATMALSGRDLHHNGRAVPAWMKHG
jgi:hypothetical protein